MFIHIWQFSSWTLYQWGSPGPGSRDTALTKLLTLSLLSPIGQRRGSDQPHPGAPGGEGEQHAGCLLCLWPADHRYGQEGAVLHAVRGKMCQHRSVSTQHFANRSKEVTCILCSSFFHLLCRKSPLSIFQSLSQSLLVVWVIFSPSSSILSFRLFQ